MRKGFWRKFSAFLALISILAQSLVLLLASAPRVYAQEEVEQVALEESVTETPIPTTSDEITASPSPEDQPQITPEEAIFEIDITLTPPENVTPSNAQTQNELEQLENQENNNSPNEKPQDEEPQEYNEELHVIVINNVSAESLDLETTVKDSSATLTTDKADYSPTDTVIISGSDFKPEQTYKLIITSENEPPAHFETEIKSDENGSFIYAYQLDGTYRPNYKVEAKDEDGNIIATITFTDDIQAPVPFSDSFGTVNSSSVTNWDEQDPAEITSGSGEDSSRPGSPTTKFAKIGQSSGGTDGWIRRTINATGFQSLQLKYYWRGDSDAESNDLGIVEYCLGATCTSFNQLVTHALNNTSWSGQQTINLPSSLNNSVFRIRFRNSSSNTDEYFRVDDVEVAGSGIVPPDTIPPTDPADVHSTDHTINVPSSDNTIAIAWTLAGSAPGASDSESGVDGYSYSFSGGVTDLPDTVKDSEESSIGTTSSSLSDGNWWFHLRTRDNAGNWTSTVHIGPFIVDTGAPVLSEATAVQTPTNDTTPAYVFNSDEEGTVSYGGSCSSPDSSAVSGNNTITFNSLLDGTYSDCTIIVTDSAENSSTPLGVSPFTVDTLAPTSSFTSPENNSFWNSSIEISGSSIDPSGNFVDYVTLYYSLSGENDWNEITQVTNNADTPFNWSYSWEPENEVTYDIKAEATDVAGNTETSPIVTNITYDITSPTDPDVFSSSHAVGTWSNDPTVDIEWGGAADFLSGVAGYSFHFDSSPSTLPDEVSEGLVTSTTSEGQGDGDSHYFHLRTLDNAGNWTSTVHFGPFFIDTVSPSTPQATPEAGDYDSDQLVTLSSTDGLSGVSAIYYTTDGSIPDNTKILYEDPITVDMDMTIRVIAYDNGGNASEILEASYGIPPIISSEISSLVTSSSVTITWETDDPATSRMVFDTVSHPALDIAPNYGYENSTEEEDLDPKVTSHSVTLGGLSPNTTYYYRTISKGSPEAISEENSVTTEQQTTSSNNSDSGTNTGGSTSSPSCSDTKPASAPTLQSAARGTNRVTLTWSEASDPVTYYLVTYGTLPGAQTYGNPNVGGKGTTSYTVSGLSAGKTYYFRVRAGNGCMPGDFSNELSATPPGISLEGPAYGFAPGVLGEQTEEDLSVKNNAPEKTEKEVLGKESVEVKSTNTARNLTMGLGIIVLILLTSFYFYRRFRR